MLPPSSLIQYLLLGKGSTSLFGNQTLFKFVEFYPLLIYIKRLLNMNCASLLTGSLLGEQIQWNPWNRIWHQYIVIITTLSEFLSERCLRLFFICLPIYFTCLKIQAVSLFCPNFNLWLGPYRISQICTKPSYRNVARFENELFYLHRLKWEIEMENLTERKTGNPFI